jgi:hypothetical protein
MPSPNFSKKNCETGPVPRISHNTEFSVSFQIFHRQSSSLLIRYTPLSLRSALLFLHSGSNLTNSVTIVIHTPLRGNVMLKKTVMRQYWRVQQSQTLISMAFWVTTLTLLTWPYVKWRFDSNTELFGVFDDLLGIAVDRSLCNRMCLANRMDV